MLFFDGRHWDQIHDHTRVDPILGDDKRSDMMAKQSPKSKQKVQ